MLRRLLTLPEGWKWTLPDAINAVIAGATILSVIATLVIIWITTKSNRAALAAAEEASRLTMLSLEETKRSNAITEQSLYLSQKPSLHVRDMRSDSTVTNGVSEFYVLFKIENAGNGTAYDARLGSVLHMDEPTLTETDVLRFEQGNHFIGSIGRELSAHHQKIYPTMPFIMENLQSGKPLHFVAVVTYEDSFGEKHRYGFSMVRSISGGWHLTDELHIEPESRANLSTAKA